MTSNATNTGAMPDYLRKNREALEEFLKDGVPTSTAGVEPNILKIKKDIGGKRLEAVYQKMYPIISKKGAPPSAMKRRPNKQILETYLLFSKVQCQMGKRRQCLHNAKANYNFSSLLLMKGCH